MTSASEDENSEEKAVEEPKAGEDEVLQDIGLELNSEFIKALYARKVGDTAVTVATLKIPAKYAATSANCTLNVSGMTAPLTIEELGSEAKETFKIIAPADADLVAKEYTVSVDVTMGEPAADQDFTKGAHRKLTAKFKLENKDFDVSATTGATITKSDDPTAYDAIWTFPAPTKENKQMPVIEGIAVKDFFDKETPEVIADFEIPTPTLATPDETGEKWTAKVVEDKTEKFEIITFSAPYHNDYKIKLVVPAYSEGGNKPCLVSSDETDPKKATDVFYYTKAAAGSEFKFKLLNGDGSDFADYTVLKSAAIKNGDTEVLKLFDSLESTTDNYTDGVFTISKKEMVEKINPLTSNPTIEITVGKATGTDTLPVKATIVLLDDDMSKPYIGNSTTGATYSHVKGSDKPAVFKVTNPVAGMTVTVKKNGNDLNKDDQPAVYTYDAAKGELTITSAYLNGEGVFADNALALTAKFEWAKDGENESTINVTLAADEANVTLAETTYTFPTKATESTVKFVDVELKIGDLSAYKTVSSVYATYGEVGKEEKVELPSGNWALKANESKVVISKDWFESIRTAQWMTAGRKIKFHVVFEALLDGSTVDVETSNELEFTGVKDAEKLAFTFNDGKGVEKVLKANGDLDYYYTVLEITKKPAATQEDAAVEKEMKPFDLEPVFDGANGKKLYEMNFTLVSADPETVKVKEHSTILTPVKATTDKNFVELTLTADNDSEGDYGDPVKVRVYVVDKTAKQKAVANEGFKIPGVTVNESNTAITLTKTGDYAKGEFDLADLYHGIALPPYLEDAAPDTIKIEAAYSIDSLENATEEQKAAEKAVVGRSGTKITALTNPTDKVPNVKFKLTIKDSANGFIYTAPDEITVTTKVVDAASDTISLARYESQDEKLTAADKAALLKAYDAAGITVNGNTISLNEEKFMLAMNSDELKTLKSSDSYVVPVLITTSAKTETTTVKYEISKTLTDAQGITSPKDTYDKGIKREVAVHNGTDFTKVDDKFFITWEVTTGIGAEATKKVSVSEVTVKVDVDTKTETSFNSGAWEIYTPANTAGYAASGITVTGNNIVYNESAVNKDAQNKLDKIYLMVKAPAGATGYAISGDMYTYDKTVPFTTGMEPKAAVLDFSIASLIETPNTLENMNKYIRWEIKTEASGETPASTTYSYTKASSNYSFTKLKLDELSNYAFNVKKSKIALTDNKGKLATDALAAGGNAVGIKLNSEVIYQSADGKDATPNKTLTDGTNVTWDYDFTPAVKTETSFPDMKDYAGAKKGVYVKFGTSTKPGAQTMDIRVSEHLSKGGTLVIKATIHNEKIISDITETITLKINPPHYVESAIPSANSVQLMLAEGKTVSYSPKVTLYPNAKAMFDNKDTIWTITAVDAEAKATIDAKTGKATFDKAGKYTLIATYKAKKLGSDNEETLAAASINVVVVDKNSAYKSLALKNSKDGKVVDLFKTTDSTKLTKTVPVLVAKEAKGEHTIDPADATTYNDYKDLISYQIVQGKNNAEGADIQIDANGNITADVTNGGATAKVTALMMGKSVTFTVNAYTTSSDDKVQMLLKNGETALTSKTPPVAGVTYKYSFATTGKTNADVGFDYKTAVITGDNKSLIEGESYEIDEKNQSITFTKPVSGKLNFTFAGDPKSRKGSYAVNTSKNAEAPTSIYFGTGETIWSGDDAYLDNDNRFIRTGPSDATLTINPVLTPSWANNQLTWTVSNSKLASIKAGKNGEAVLTWKKAAADGEQLFVTATSKDKKVKTSYTMQLTTVDALEDVYINGNPKSIFINVADNSVGTMIPLSQDFTSVDVVTYDKKDKEYIHAEGYDASIQDNIVTLRASSTAKSGKFFLALQHNGSNVPKPYYVAITTKLAKVTEKTAVSITGKVAAINNHVYGYMAPITLTGKNIDPLAAMLEMDASVSEALNLSLVKEDGQWYLKYTGDTVADKAKTAPTTVTIKCSVPGVTLTTASFPLKVTYKAASTDYGFTVKPAKLLTLGGNIGQGKEVYLDLVSKSGVLDRALKNNEITDAELVTGKAKGTFLGNYMEAKINKNESDGSNDDSYGIYLKFLSEDANGNKITPASLTNGKYVANLKVTYKGGATAEAPITLTVNTDTSAKTVKISKAIITGAMPILSSSLSEATAKIELTSRGAYLTFTKSADLADHKITDVRVTSPSGFVVDKSNGVEETFQIAYQGEASAYNAIKGKLTLEVAFGGTFDAKDKAEQPVVTATVQVAKPSAGYDKLASYKLAMKVTEGETSSVKELKADLNGNYSAEMTVGGDPLVLCMFDESTTDLDKGTEITGMTMTSSDPTVVKPISYLKTLLPQGKSDKAVITISKPGYVESRLTVNVKGADFNLKTSEELKATATGYTYTTKFDPDKTGVTLASLFEEDKDEGVTVVVPTEAQDTVTFKNNTFTFHKVTTGTKVTLKKAFADDIELTFVVTAAESRPDYLTIASKEFVEIKDNTVTIKGLGVGGKQSFILPTPYEKGKWTAKSNSASVVTAIDTQTGNTVTFERKADAAENVVVTLSMDGYEDITVTILPSQKSAADLLGEVAALKDGFGDALWVANGKGTLTLTMETPKEITIANFKVGDSAVTIDATGATEYATVTPDNATKPTKYTITPVKVTATATPKFKLSAKGYEDAEITVVVKATDATEDATWTVAKTENVSGTGKLSAITNGKGTLTGIKINAKDGADEAIVTFTAANGATTAPKLTITPTTSDELTIIQTTVEGVVTVKFKATEYFTNRDVEFTADGYKPVLITVSTVDRAATDMISHLNTSTGDDAILVKTGTADAPTLQLNLTMGNEIEFVFGKDIDVTTGDKSVADYVTIEPVSTGSTRYKITPKKPVEISDNKAITLKADGYTDLEVTLNIAEGTVTPYDDKTALSKVSGADDTYSYTLTGDNSPATITFKDSKDKPIAVTLKDGDSYDKAKAELVTGDDNGTGKVKLTYVAKTDENDPAILHFEFKDIDASTVLYNEVTIKVTVQESTTPLTDFVETINSGTVKASAEHVELVADTLEVEVSNFLKAGAPEITASVVTVSGQTDTENTEYAEASLTDGKLTVTGKKATGNTEIFLKLKATGFTDAKIPLTVVEGKSMTVAEQTTADKWTGNDKVEIEIPASDSKTESFKVKGENGTVLKDVTVSEKTPNGDVSVSGSTGGDGTITITVTSSARENADAEKITVTRAGYTPLVITVATKDAPAPAL